MRWTRLLQMAVVVVVLVACGGNGSPQGDGVQTREPESPAPTPSPTPSPTPAPEDQPGGTYANPLPAGTTFVLSDWVEDSPDEPVELWEVTLEPTNQDATDEVLAEGEFNEIAEDRAAVMVPVMLTHVGPEAGEPWLDLEFQFVGADGNTYSTGPDDYCGVIPNDLADHGEMFPGATVTGNVCQAVPDDVIDGGAWIVALSFAWDDERVFVSVD